MTDTTKPSPFDPSQFTAEELALARQLLLALRRIDPGTHEWLILP